MGCVVVLAGGHRVEPSGGDLTVQLGLRDHVQRSGKRRRQPQFVCVRVLHAGGRDPSHEEVDLLIRQHEARGRGDLVGLAGCLLEVFPTECIAIFPERLRQSEAEQGGHDKQGSERPDPGANSRTGGAEPDRGENGQKRDQQEKVLGKRGMGAEEPGALRRRQPAAQIEFGPPPAVPAAFDGEEQQAQGRKQRQKHSGKRPHPGSEHFEVPAGRARPIDLAVKQVVFDDVKEHLTGGLSKEPEQGEEGNNRTRRKGAKPGPPGAGPSATQCPTQQQGTHGRGEERRSRGDAGAETRARRPKPLPAVCGQDRKAKCSNDQEKAQPVGLSNRAVPKDRGVQTGQQRHGKSTGQAPGGLLEAHEDEVRSQQHRSSRQDGRECVSDAPVFAEDSHPGRIPRGIQRRLGKEEVEIRSLPGQDQLRRQQVKAFVPRKGESLGIDEHPEAKKGDGARDHQELGLFPVETHGTGSLRLDASLWSKRCSDRASEPDQR